MSRKDYIKLARIIKDNTIDTNSIDKYSFIEDLCDVLKQNNINFVNHECYVNNAISL